MVLYRRQYIHTWKGQVEIFPSDDHVSTCLLCSDSISTETNLSTLQPDVLEFIINRPISSNASEEAPETGRRDSSLLLVTQDIIRQYFHLSTTPVPVYSVMRVFEPEIHYSVQLCANVLSTLLQLQHGRHRSLKNKNQFMVKGEVTFSFGFTYKYLTP